MTQLGTYFLGFFLSIILTLAAYFSVVWKLFSGNVLLGAIVLLAIAQAFVQIFLFLHLGKEKPPKWRQHIFGYTLCMVAILVGGTLWIMNNLNYNMMRP